MDDQSLRAQFEDCSLPAELWTHRAHVKVAFLYVRELGFDEALDRMRRGLKAYILKRNVEETPTSGYNETTTRAFMHLIAATMQAYSEAKPTPDAEAFCQMHPQLLCKEALRFFYSPERRMLPEAKHGFVEPDLAPLPRLSVDCRNSRLRS
jgi:hypothetical protein